MSKAIGARDVNVRDVAAASEINRLLKLDHAPWYKKKNLRMLYFTLVPAALGVEMTSGYDGSVLNGLQAVDPWLEYFNNPNGALLGVLSAAFNIGAVIALPFVPYCNDRWGRKFCVVFGSILSTAGAILQGASQNFGMFLAARLIMGTGIPFAISGAAQLIAELAYPKERSVITGLFNESWYAGAILAAGVTLGTYFRPDNWSWRIPSILQIVPSMLQLIFIWFVPESPRFLVSKDRHEEALAILVKYHAEGNASSPFVAAEFHQIRQTIRREFEASKSPWKELVTTRTNLRRVLIAVCIGFFTQWSGNGLVSYYLARVLESIGITERRIQNQLNLGLMCWNLVTGVTGSFITHILPRRVQYLISYSAMTILFACWTAASAVYAQDNDDSASGRAVVALIFIYYGFYNLMMPLTYIYLTEVFPFLQRSKGVAITQFFSRGGSAFNSFVNPIGLESIEWRYYLVYVAWLATETGIIFVLFPETKGVSLEEAAIVMDGDRAHVEVIHVGATDKDGASVEEMEYR